MKDDFKIDLQLFAQEAGGAGQETPEGGEPTPNTPGNPDKANDNQGTILGQAGQPAEPNPTNSPTTNQPAANNAPQVYDFSGIVPEGMEYDQQAATEFGNLARECNLSQDQAAKVAAYGMKYMQGGVNSAMEQLVQQKIGWGEEKKKQLGADFDKTVSMSAVGINKLSEKIPGFREMLNETGAGNRIEMIQFMAAVGALFGEDGGHGVEGAAGGEKSLYPNTNFGQYR